MIVLPDAVAPWALRKAASYIETVPDAELLWPLHRFAPDIMRLLAYLPRQRGDLCEPQLLRQRPDRDVVEHPLDYHLDEPPPYARGRGYEAIFGVAITAQEPRNGGVRFQSLDSFVSPRLRPGDVILFGGSEAHCGGTNRSGEPRVAVYFRFLPRA